MYELDDAKIQATLAAIPGARNPDGSINSTRLAATLRVSRSTAQARVKRLAEKGLLGFKPVLPGFAVRKVSSQIDADGEVQKTYIQQGPERGPEFAVPVGHVVKGVSALVDADGRTVQQWIKTRDDNKTGDIVEAIKSAFDAYKGRAELSPAPEHTDADLLTVFGIGDQHHSMLAWKDETGANYDLKISQEILLNTMSRLVSSAPSAETAIILNLGDFFHTDSQDNRTLQSHNQLDVDGRYAKMLQTGVRLMIDCIEMALQKHKRVIVRNLQGNHSPHTEYALSIAMAAFFHANDRVTVDCSPSKFFWHIHGRVFIAATHGDMAKPDQIAGIMASNKPVEWGQTDHRYALFGHVHHSSKGGGEGSGVRWETFQTLASKDAWHHAKGYSAGRSMTAINYHKIHGEYSRNTVSIPQFR